MSEIQMINKMESVVKSIVERYLQDHPEFCACDRCRLDMIALTLNSLPPRYAVTTLGEVFTDVNLQGIQSTADIMMALMRSIEIVKKKPRH
ncbi:MAG: late competence development ComFB family protein [Candidatus Riflebacteria bacterium]|nr:late competence development ComFB family protein [Candidatus Riflebacteria bacterium]